MDKCWFVLSQTHVPPPRDEDGAFKQTGPLCLGHFIKDLKHLDHVINTSGPEPFPLDTPIVRTGPIEFEWNSSRELGIDVSVAADVPSSVPGINAKASVGLALKRSLGTSWQIEQLETLTVDPSRPYINRCLAGEQIVEFLADNNKFRPTWKIFMVTGLKIVRGNSTQTISRGRERGINAGPGVGVAGIAEASVQGGFSSGTSTSTSAMNTHDFIWAVRLSKITKGLFDKKWSKETFSKGATFNMQERGRGIEIESILLDEGLADSEVLMIEDNEPDLGHIVIPAQLVTTEDQTST